MEGGGWRVEGARVRGWRVEDEIETHQSADLLMNKRFQDLKSKKE